MSPRSLAGAPAELESTAFKWGSSAPSAVFQISTSARASRDARLYSSMAAPVFSAVMPLEATASVKPSGNAIRSSTLTGW